MASIARATRTMTPTSCPRITSAPFMMPTATAAAVPSTRSCTGSPPRMWPIVPLREGPITTGSPRTRNSRSRRMISRFCWMVFPNPKPGSTKMRSRDSPVATADSIRSSTKFSTSATTPAAVPSEEAHFEVPYPCISTTVHRGLTPLKSPYRHRFKDVHRVLLSLEEVRQHRGLSITGVPEMPERPGIFNRPQQCVVVGFRIRAVPTPAQWADCQHRHFAASGLSTAARLACAFVPGRKEHSAVPPGARGEYFGNDGRKPPIPLPGFTVMHAVAHVGRDPDEVRQRSSRQVHIEFGKRNHLPAAGRVRGDVGVVDERTVLLGVLAGGASQKACRGQPFHIGLPGPLMRLDLIGEILTGDGTVCAVIRDPESISPGQRDVVGQAGMCDGIVRIRHRIIPR